jgi:hypothetical protein
MRWFATKEFAERTRILYPLLERRNKLANIYNRTGNVFYLNLMEWYDTLIDKIK